MTSERLPAPWMIRSSIVNRVTDIAGDVWVLAIVAHLLERPHRFDELVTGLGIARSTLSGRLALLREQECVHKVVEPQATAPADRAYALTPRGRDLLALLRQFRQWNRRWGAREGVLDGLTWHNPCGHDADALLQCQHCHGAAVATDMKVLQTAVRAPQIEAAVGRRLRAAEAPVAQRPIPAEGLIGDRWTSLILGAAFFGAKKYSEIEAALGIAPQMLAGRLERLVQQGLLERLRYSSHQTRHAYRLTECGLSSYSQVVAMTAWGRKWLDPEDDPGWRVLHRTCVEWFDPEFVCGECGAVVL